MFEISESFIISLIELTTIMFLWSKFSLKEESSKVKNISVIFLGSLTLAVSLYIGVNIIIVYIIIILSVKFIYKRPLIKTILEYSIFSIIIIIAESFFILILKNFLHDIDISSFIVWISIEIIILVLSILSYYLIFNKRKYYIKSMNSKAIYYFVVNLGICLGITKLILIYDEEVISNNLFIYMVCLLIIFLLQMYLYFYMVKIIEEKKQLEMENRYIAIIEETIEEVKRRQHDFKNYINTINGIIDVSDEKELKQELKKYTRVGLMDNKNMEDILHINNTTIKAIVYSKLCEAERSGISFSYTIKNNLVEGKLKNYELSDILNNLLNNAFEAVHHKENNDDKCIVLNIIEENHKSIIEVKNNGIAINVKDIDNIFKRGYSTKGEKNRGYGLYNVKKIVKNNRGSIQLFFQNDYTVFKILF